MKSTSSLRLGEWTVVVLCDGREHRGVLYTADPESGHVTLLQPASSADECSVIPTILLYASIAKIVQGAEERQAQMTLPADASLTLEGIAAADAVTTAASAWLSGNFLHGRDKRFYQLAICHASADVSRMKKPRRSNDWIAHRHQAHNT